MFGVNDGFFIQADTNSPRRILHPAKILSVQDELFTFEIEEDCNSLEKDQEFFIYYEIEKQFSKQAARIKNVFADPEKLGYAFVTVGEPASAESRQQFRVSTILSDLTASFGKETDCKVLDVSAKGFSVVGKKRHDIGATLDADMRHEGQRYWGKVCIQGAREYNKDSVRYGLHCVDEPRSKANLIKGLWKMTMTFQRQQLRRLSGKS